MLTGHEQPSENVQASMLVRPDSASMVLPFKTEVPESGIAQVHALLRYQVYWQGPHASKHSLDSADHVRMCTHLPQFRLHVPC